MARRSAPPRRFACIAMLSLAMSTVVSTSAFAQWVWKDSAGQVVASDQAPPPGVPQANILKQPRRSAAVAAPPTDPAAAAVAAKDAGRIDAPKSLADRELEYKQQQKEQAEAAKKSDEDATKNKAMQDNCSAVRGNLAALQAGGRAARFNDKGERVYLDDAQRQSEIAKSQGQISQYCK